MSARERADEDAIEVELGLSDFALVTGALETLERIFETAIRRMAELGWSQWSSFSSERAAQGELKLDSLREARERILKARYKWQAATGEWFDFSFLDFEYHMWTAQVLGFLAGLRDREALARKRDSCSRPGE